MSALRRLRAAAAAACLVCAAAPGVAQEDADGFAAAVTSEEISITSDFQGAEITIFGATPARRSGDVVVVVRGPGAPVTVMRREQILGLWVNSDPVVFEAAPGFFAVMTAKPLAEIASRQAIWELGLDPAGAARLTGPTPEDADPAAYRAALVRLKEGRALYQNNPRGLSLRPGGLFAATVRLPANAPPGLYRAEVYFFRNRRLVSTETSTVPVNRIGVERLIHDFADTRPILYGLVTVLVALAAGWSAALAFGRRA